MEQRVSLITLGLADLRRSTEFYEHLGWRRSCKAGQACSGRLLGRLFWILL